MTSFFSMITYEKNKSGLPSIQDKSSDEKLLQFWTPSSETGPSILADSTNGPIGPQDSWEVNVAEAKVDRFETELWNQFGRNKRGPLQGLRRFKTTGHGRSRHKSGWWWTLTIDRDFDAKKLAKFYFDFWGNSKEVYMEEFSGTSEYE